MVVTAAKARRPAAGETKAPPHTVCIPHQLRPGKIFGEILAKIRNISVIDEP
jgi:hypothetical protein